MAFSLPGLLFAYYNLVLFVSILRYPKQLGQDDQIHEAPSVSILIATFNEKFVIAKTLDAIKQLNYPKEKLSVIVADDSTDDTVGIIDRKVYELKNLGIHSVVNRRKERIGFKRGSLQEAVPLLTGDYVLLLDADSTLAPTTLIRGLNVFKKDPKIGFVSFRIGHYNREQNIITRIFALQTDQGDTITKMGAYVLDAPYSFQGGFVLVSAPVLKQAGYWMRDSIVEDADLSCRIYCKGYRGVYLSDVRIFSEDPSSLEVWKKQAARVAQGWARCALANGKEILACKKLPIWKRIVLFSTLVGPFQGICWLIVTFLSALALILGLTAPANSIFSNPLYIGVVTVPVIAFFISGIYALHIQKMITPHNLVVLPLMSYTTSCMTTATIIGFLNGIRGKTGYFFRTPKYGQTQDTTKQYHRDISLDNIAIAEGIISAISIALGSLVLFYGVWTLALTLIAFGILTLKSMGLSRLFVPKPPAVA